MSTPTSRQLWQRLREHALVEGDMPPVTGSSSPWYVRVMLGVAGWIGALFLLGFIGVGFEFVIKSASASLAVGALCCAVAFGIFRLARDNDFATQFGLAVSFAGQAMLAFGLYKTFEPNTSSVFFMVFVFQALLAVFVPNFIHRVLTSWSAMFALSLSLVSADLHVLASGIAAAACALIWLNEFHWPAHPTLWRPIGYGLVLSLLQIDAVNLFGHDFWHEFSRDRLGAGWLLLHAPWIGTALAAAIFVWVVTRLLAREEIPPSSGAGMAAIVAAMLVAALSFVAPGVATALMILLLGFASGNRILMGLGLLALGGFVSHYYYQLQHTLLFKAMVLAGSGAVLLLARMALQKCFQTASAKENIDA